MDSCNIKVAIKARPFNHKEQLDGRVYWKIESDSVIHIDSVTEKRCGEQFFFDRVFSDKSTNHDVFDEIVRPIIDRGVQGFNGTVFAYGQTASGKTYTMSGDQSNPGIIPLAINYMFSVMNSSTTREYLLRVCYLEIYNEKVIDLLEKNEKKSQIRKIEIQKDGLHITPLKAIVCQNAQMVIDLMKIGDKYRSIGETNMNERSSRSHTIFRIILESRNVDDDCDGAYQQSVINLVDLAGSEQSNQIKSSMEQFKEGCKINSSLTTLGLVIQQLSECPDSSSSQHINFRGSKLTRVLQTSLGGNSLTAIICTVTLAVEDETQNTLSFASRAKKIKNSAKVNENITDVTLLKRYKVQISKLNEELEGMKQNQYESDEVNEIKYKFQEEKRTNEELKERIMRLQSNMITSSVEHKDHPLNKKGFNRRRTWGGKLDSTFSTNSILETIEEDINMHRPSVPSNFGNLNKEFKTPLEPFEWDLIQDEDRAENTQFLNNNDITDHELSPPTNIRFSVCETPKKVLRERVNNYKNMFEMSIKENNELREFTTLEKQMLNENNEQLKDLDNLRKQVDDLKTEKNESAKMIEKLKSSVEKALNEKRDVDVIMEMLKNKFESRETELLAIIQDTRDELKSKEEQLKKVISCDIFMTEKQEEIKRLDMKIRELSQLNYTYINEIEVLKSQLLDQNQQLNEELSKRHEAEIKSVPLAIQFLSSEGYFTLNKNEIDELDQLFKKIHDTVEQLQHENQSLKDENNNFKLITNDFTNHMNDIKIENNELRLQLNLIKANIMNIVKDFSTSSEINVDNSSISSIVELAVEHFKKIKIDNDKFSSENRIHQEELSFSINKLSETKAFVFDNLDGILKHILTLEVKLDTENEKFKIQLSETIKENIFLKSSIQEFNKLMFECIDIVGILKTNQSNYFHIQEKLDSCYVIQTKLHEQIEQLNRLNDNLKIQMENQTKFEKDIRKDLEIKSSELKDALAKVDEMQLNKKDSEHKFELTDAYVNQLKMEFQNVKSNLEEKEKNENRLKDELVSKTIHLQNCLDELKEVKLKVVLKESEIEQLNTQVDSIKFEFDEKLKILMELENIKLELSEQMSQLNDTNSELKIRIDQKLVSENEIQEKLQTTTKELEIACSQVNDLRLTLENNNLEINSNISIIKTLNSELDNIKFKLEEKSQLLEEFESNKLEAIKVRKLKELKSNDIISELESKLKEKLIKEQLLENELQTISVEIENATAMVNHVKSVIEILSNKCESNTCIVKQLQSSLDEKINLIAELEKTNFEVSTKCDDVDVTNKLNNIIAELKMKLQDETNINVEIQSKLQGKTLQLEHALIKENEVQTLVESMENEIKSNIEKVEQFKLELVTKSNLLTKLEHKYSELLMKFDEINETNKKYVDKLENSQSVHIQEKTLIQSDLKLANQKLLDMTKQHNELKKHVEDILQQQAMNYQNLFTDFSNMSCDIESLLSFQIDTECKLREEILIKAMEFDDLYKQLHESSLQQDYEKLEEEYMLRSRECDEAQEKLVLLETKLSMLEDSETVLRNNFKSKCNALEEYKKNVEFLFMRNDSFQIRVNDFEDNVLVDLNEEFDSMKSELEKKTEYEKTLLAEKSELEYNLNEIKLKLTCVTKELELNETRSEELASIVDILVDELKDANSSKENLKFCLNEAEHELLKSEDFAKILKHELYTMQRELENACINAECMEKTLYNFKSITNDELKLKNCNCVDDKNQLITSLVDYVHDIKLKLTELNSAIISGNQSEKQFRTKVMSVDDGDILPLCESWKVSCTSHSVTPDIGIGLEIDNLHKVLEDKIDLVNTLQKAKNDVEKNINELQKQIKELSKDNNIFVTEIKNMKDNLREKNSLVSSLSNELEQLKTQFSELEEHNQAIKEQIHYSFDIDSELRIGKKNLINEINLLEPGKITGVITNHTLSNLLNIFVSLIMTKEQLIVNDLVNDHNKIKQQFIDEIKQYEEDIKKGKEWQEQVESDNEKLCLELENLKSQKHNFPSSDIEIKELTEKLLKAKNQLYSYSSELQELKTQLSKTNEQNYHALSNEFDVFKTSSEQSIVDLEKKIENLTIKYKESLNLYHNQKNNCSALESQIEKLQSECICLNAIIEKKDEDIKNLFEKVLLKTNEYEELIEKSSFQREEIKNINDKKIDELQLELNEKIQKIYCTEKLLKEVTKKYNQLVEESSSNILLTKKLQENDSFVESARVAKLECDTHTITTMDKTKYENLETELEKKNMKLQETEAEYSKLVQELEINKLKIIAIENQLESCNQTLKFKDNQINEYQLKSKINDNDLIDRNSITEKLREILKCSGPLPTLYENIRLLITKCQCLEVEIEELKHTNMNLDNECESMLDQIKSRDDNILELLTKEDELNQYIELLIRERDNLKQNVELLTGDIGLLKNECANLKNKFENIGGDFNKLNDEICGYEQNIYQLRKEKGQLIVQHEKELKQMKSELQEVHTKNLELLNDYNKLSETAKNLEKSLKEDLQQLNRCIVDKNAKISTLELFSKTNTDNLKKKNHELEQVYKRSRDENHMLRRELRRFKDMANINKVDQYTQTVEEQSIVNNAMVGDYKIMSEKIAKLESDHHMMKKILHLRKVKIEELQKQLNDRH